MLNQSMVRWFGIVLPLSLAASVAAAQSEVYQQEPASSPPAMASTAPAPADSVAPEAEPAKKKGGLFGKVKSVAKNKVVQSVVKTAACTMVPGGQFVAGAIDAAANKNAATGAVGAASGSSCAPGLGGMGMNPGAPGGESAALAGVQAAQVAGGTGANGSAQMMAAMQMQMMSTQMAQLQQAGGVGMMGEAMGRPIAVSSEKGKTVIRNIDWVPGTGTVSAAGTEGFRQALMEAGAAALEAGGSYRLDLYLDKQSPEAVAKAVGPQRLSMVQGALSSGPMAGRPEAVPQPGKIKRDNDPRLEIVRRK